MPEFTTSEEAKRQEQFFLIGMVASMFLWGVSWTTAKVLSSYAEAPVIAFVRFIFTFFSMIVILKISKIDIKIKLDASASLNLFISATCMSLYSYLFFLGLSYGKAGAGAVLVTMLNPIISYLIMLITNKRLPNKIESIGLILGLTAAIFLLQLWQNLELVFVKGNIFFLCASFTWSILSLFTAKSSKYGSPLAFSFWMYGLGALLVLPFCNTESISLLIARADIYFWLNLLLTATLTTAMATSFYFYATTKIGASKASSFIFLVPFSAMFISWLFLHEVPKWNTLVGACFGVIAVYVLNKQKR